MRILFFELGTPSATKKQHASDLEEQLAQLRDQEAELVRAIELVIADEKAQKLTTEPFDLISGEKPTADLKDYELKAKHVAECKKRRAKAFWGDVRKVVNALKNVKALNSVFGLPVKETQWGSVPKHYEVYTAVISHPMDLRTIRRKLGDDENSQQYQAPHEVVHDIQLIVENCNKFNTGAQNEQVRKLAESLGQQFDKRWREGLFEQRWQKELAQQQLELEELQELKAAANGGPVEKARYFENCAERRLKDLPVGPISEHKPLTWEQKRRLSIACSKICDADCAAVLDIIAQSSQMPSEKDGEVVVTLDTLPDSVLYRIQKRVEIAQKKKVEEAVQPAAPPRQPVEVAEPRSAPQKTLAVASAKAIIDVSATLGGEQSKESGGNSGDATRDNGQIGALVDTARAASHGGPVLANGGATAAGGAGPVDSETQNSSSSGSDNSSSSSDDNGNSKGSSNATEQGKASNSADSQQGESGAAVKEYSPREKHTSADGAETVLVSRNVPLGDEQPAPSILKAKDEVKEIQIENEDDWAVPAEIENEEEDNPPVKENKSEPETTSGLTGKSKPVEESALNGANHSVENGDGTSDKDVAIVSPSKRKLEEVEGAGEPQKKVALISASSPDALRTSAEGED